MIKIAKYFLIILLFCFGCKDQKEKTGAQIDMMTPREISNSDYYLEYNEGFPDRHYLNDHTVMNGRFKIVENGLLKEEIFMENGIKNGVHKYFKDTVVIRETAYKNGLRHGASTSYFENGKVRSSDRYQNDSLSGKSISYDAAGNIESERKVVNGLSSNKRYKEGKLIGEEYEYEHAKGLLSILKTYDQNGNVNNRFGFITKNAEFPVFYIYKPKNRT